MFLLNWYQPSVWTLRTQTSLSRSQIYRVLQSLNAAPTLCHAVTTNARTFSHNNYTQSVIFIISNNPSVCHKHLGVPDASDGSDRTSYPLTENYMLPVAEVMGRIAYLPSLLCARNMVTYTHHQHHTWVRLFAVAAVILYPLTQRLGMLMLFFGR